MRIHVSSTHCSTHTHEAQSTCQSTRHVVVFTYTHFDWKPVNYLYQNKILSQQIRYAYLGLNNSRQVLSCHQQIMLILFFSTWNIFLNNWKGLHKKTTYKQLMNMHFGAMNIHYMTGESSKTYFLWLCNNYKSLRSRNFPSCFERLLNIKSANYSCKKKVNNDDFNQNTESYWITNHHIKVLKII